jgi:hypothetical protein
MYAAAGDQRRAIELTNRLLALNEVVETNVIADRLGSRTPRRRAGAVCASDPVSFWGNIVQRAASAGN